MTDAQITGLLAQYQAGLEAELSLLDRLETLATRQRDASETCNFEALGAASDERDRTMSALVVIEHELKPIRQVIAERRESLAELSAFEAVAALHRHAAQRVTAIVGTDARALAALKEAEQARRFAAMALEQGENTLAAYRRVVAPAPEHASLISRKG